MIIEGIFNFLKGIINLIPFELPDMPEQFYTILNMIFDGITNSLALLDLFIDLRFWLTCAGIMLVISNIRRIWNFFIWILNLIPSVNIKPW